jgi:iron(III) transport system substrate-binding protein
MMVNSKLVMPAEAPKDWRDILDPKWKGQVAIGHPGLPTAIRPSCPAGSSSAWRWPAPW